MRRTTITAVTLVVAAAGLARPAPAQDPLVRVALSYRAPGGGPAPNFSPKGTQVPLEEIDAGARLPEGASRPARTGTLQIGPDERAWVRVLAAATAAHPRDLCRLYVDRNRNGNFGDDGPALDATPSVREKTGDSWSSFSRIQVDVPYASGAEPYMVNVWIVRQGENPPSVLRYSVASWRSGSARVGGVEALVAAMDGNNDALFGPDDYWSVLEASAPNAATRVLSHAEARPSGRLMFVGTGAAELVLEFRAFTPDGRAVTFALVDRPVTKAADRSGDDTVAAERARPRAAKAFPWHDAFDAALAAAERRGRHLIVDFWTSWCGPCATMDEWIWTDAEVAALLDASYVGVKLDGDVQKALVARFGVRGYPTVVVLAPDGTEVVRFEGYRSSQEVLALLKGR